MNGLTRRATPVFNQVIFDFTLPAAALVTYLRILALAWQADFRHTQPLNFAGELLPLLGVQKTQARQHLRLLRMAKLLYWKIDAAGRYTIYFLALAPPETGNPAPDVAGVESSLVEIDISQQPSTQAENPESRVSALPRPGGFPGVQAAPMPDPWADELAALLGEPIFAETMGWLAHVGVWTDHAMRIARQIHSNELRGQNYLPTRADVLGWIAFCFAFRRENKVEKPVQVVSINLSNNRRCPEHLRAPRICRKCGLAEGWCQCHDQPEYYYPASFIDFAREAEYDPSVQTFWGVCLSCHAARCTCGACAVD